MITLSGPGKNHGLYTSGNSKQFGPKNNSINGYDNSYATSRISHRCLLSL